MPNFSDSLVLIHLLETVVTRLIVRVIDWIREEVGHRIRRTFIVFIVADLKGMWAGYRDSFVPRYVGNGTWRVRNQDKKRSFWEDFHDSTNSRVRILLWERRIRIDIYKYHSCLLWLGCIFRTSAGVSWLLLRSRYLLVILFPQSLHCRRLRQILLLLFSYCLILQVPPVLLLAGSYTGLSSFLWGGLSLEICQLSMLQAQQWPHSSWRSRPLPVRWFHPYVQGALLYRWFWCFNLSHFRVTVFCWRELSSSDRVRPCPRIAGLIQSHCQRKFYGTHTQRAQPNTNGYIVEPIVEEGNILSIVKGAHVCVRFMRRSSSDTCFLVTRRSSVFVNAIVWQELVSIIVLVWWH